MSTENFYGLEPEIILEATENIGTRSTGRCFALNSVENRVYDVELEDDTRVISKFYRPGRWSKQAILEEHEFLKDLDAAEIPVAAPLTLTNNSTIGEIKGMYFSVFPKRQGRSPDELDEDQLRQAGRLIARIHNVGSQKKIRDRGSVSIEEYGVRTIDLLSKGNWIAMEVKTRYEDLGKKLIDAMKPLFEGIEYQRIHGDCHRGNLLYGKGQFFFLDFDDMRQGPCVQDLWLLTPGRDAQTTKDREVMLEGYQEIRSFNRRELNLVEPLRTLRILHFSAWIAQRWSDPSFKRLFPQFETFDYWSREVETLNEQLQIISQIQTTAE